MIATPEQLSMNMVISIYNTEGIDGSYLYLDPDNGLNSIPDSWQSIMGRDDSMPDILVESDDECSDSETLLDEIDVLNTYWQALSAYSKDDYTVLLPDPFSTF